MNSLESLGTKTLWKAGSTIFHTPNGDLVTLVTPAPRRPHTECQLPAGTAPPGVAVGHNVWHNHRRASEN